MTTGTFIVVLVLATLALAGVIVAFRALSARRRNRPGAGSALAAGVLLIPGSAGPVMWEVQRYFDLRDGVVDSRFSSAPIYRTAIVCLAAAIVLGSIAGIQRLASRRAATRGHDHADHGAV